MLTRRHIRVKVMQCIYALIQSKDDSLEKQEKFLKYSIDSMYTLYLLMFSLLTEIHQLAEKHVNHASKKYMASEDVIELYKEIIAPNEKIYEYFEDDKLTWIDDIPIVNTFIIKQLKKVKEDAVETFFLPRLLKDDDDMVFAQQLLTKTLLKNDEWEKEIEGKTPNWDKDRIAEIDYILLKMGICELLNFSSIPEKVTINEYLEIAKEYSTPKSSIFINGILDKLVKEYKAVFKFTNTGDAPLIITDAKSSCGCTVPNPPKDPIAPGDSGEMLVKFNGSGQNQVTKTITVTANTAKGSELLRIKAFVNPKGTAAVAGPVKG